MNNAESIKIIFIELVREMTGLEKEEIRHSDSFASDLGLHHLDIAELILLTEEKFDIFFPDTATGNFNTVGLALGYIEREAGKKQKDESKI